jgi:hypothetical protein
MIIALHAGRVLMVVWIIYGLFQSFAPHLLHQPPSDVVASVNQHLVDRAQTLPMTATRLYTPPIVKDVFP